MKLLSILKLYWIDDFSYKCVTCNPDVESCLIKIVAKVDLTDGTHPSRRVSLSIRMPVWNTPTKCCLSTRLFPHPGLLSTAGLVLLVELNYAIMIIGIFFIMTVCLCLLYHISLPIFQLIKNWHYLFLVWVIL